MNLVVFRMHWRNLLAPVVLAGSLFAQPVTGLEPRDPPALWLLESQAAPGMFRGDRSFLGVGVVEVTAQRAKELKLKEERGVEITRVEENSPAAKAGLKVGDVVLEYNGQKVEGTEQFIRLVRETPVGRQVKLLVSRDGVTQTVTVTMGARTFERLFTYPGANAENVQRQMEQLQRQLEKLRDLHLPEMPKPFFGYRTSALGVVVEELEPQLAEYFGVKNGVLVRAVMNHSPAEQAGLKAGDVIVKIDSQTVTNPRELAKAIDSARSQDATRLTIVRRGKEITLSVSLERKEPSPAPGPKRAMAPGTKL